LQQQFVPLRRKIETQPAQQSPAVQPDKIDSEMQVSIFVLSKTVGTNTVGGPLGEFAQLFARDVNGATPTAKETFALEV